MQAFGLRTHAWNTAWRSMLLLAGFPLLLAVVALGLGMMFGGTIADVMGMAGNDLNEVVASVAAK